MSVFHLFIFLFAFCSTGFAQQRLNSTIAQNSSLTPTGNNSSWLSPSGLYAFGFYRIGDGYAVGIFLAGVPGDVVVWTANRNNATVQANVTLLLTDGRLIMRQAQSPDVGIVSVADRISSASMNDSGNFVLYNSANDIAWQSFEHPTDTLLPGQVLSDDQQLFSSASETDPSTGSFRLIMQAEGTLVLYPSEAPNLDQYAYWNSGPGTYGSGPSVSLHLNQNGYMYMMKNNTIILRNLTNGSFPDERTIYRAQIGLDGIFRLYSYSLVFGGSWSIKFATNDNKCDPKGVCGLNAYCTNQDTEIECKCLPGFDFISPDNNRTCGRNFTTEGCKYRDRSLNFNMQPLDNTWFENNSYSVVRASVKEECAQACEEDCNCEAALFNGGACGKQRLPLRYGRRRLGESTVALVKVGMQASTNTEGVGNYLPATKKKELRLDILIVSICLFVLSTVVLLAIVWTLVYGKKVLGPNNTIPRNMSSIDFVRDVAPQAFTYGELAKATNDFEEELGRGAFGTVYKGMLQNSQRVVAVKRLEKVPTEGGGETEFQNEMAVIGKTHHRNLVRLLGYCIDGAKRLLVYEYMSNGSLADILFVPERQPSWDERIRITCDIARGILYLHEECETQIIHCDIKPQNILMDQNYCAKIADFGLAKLLKHEQTKTFTAIRGTKGYVAPEWHRKLPVTVKADVYSFGIVLLEIICLRKSVDWSFPEDEAILEEWAYDCYEGNTLQKLVATDDVVDMRKLERMIKIAIWCIQGEPSLRPSMRKVLLMLEGTIDIPIPPNPASFLSTT